MGKLNFRVRGLLDFKGLFFSVSLVNLRQFILVLKACKGLAGLDKRKEHTQTVVKSILKTGFSTGFCHLFVF